MSAAIAVVHDRPEGTAALDWAVDYAKEHRLELHVVFEHTDTAAAPVYVSPAFRRQVSDRLAETGLSHKLHDPEEDVVAQVLDLIEERTPHLVAIPIRKRSAVLKLILGSNAQRIILEAPCPVVSVKAQTD